MLMRQRMHDNCRLYPASETTVEKGLWVTAEHPDNGVPSWDLETTRSLLLARKVFWRTTYPQDPFIPLLVATHTTKHLAHITSLKNLKELILMPDRSVVRPLVDLKPLLFTKALTQLCMADCIVTDCNVMAQLPLLQVLDLSRTHVCDLLPLHGVELQTLRLAGTEVQDLSPLSGMHSLKALDLSRCTGVVAINSLAQLSQLEYLNLLQTGVCNLLPLHDLSLCTLYLDHTNFHDLSPLSRMCSLEQLHIRACLQLTSVATLAQLTCLKTLDMGFTIVAHVAPLAGLNLEVLILQSTLIEGVGPLSSMTSLKKLDLSFCGLSNIAALAHLTCLSFLSLSSTAVTSLLPLSGLHLTYLDVSDSPVHSLDELADMHTLEELDLSWCRTATCSGLARLRLPNLKILDLSAVNGFYDLWAVAGLPLQRLFLHGANISDLSALSDMTTLQRLSVCDCNLLEDIAPLARLTDLQFLDIANTQVSDIGALRDLQLEELWLSNTKVSDLGPLWGMSTLQGLHVDGCPVEDPSALAASSPRFAEWLEESGFKIT